MNFETERKNNNLEQGKINIFLIKKTRIRNYKLAKIQPQTSQIET